MTLVNGHGYFGSFSGIGLSGIQTIADPNQYIRLPSAISDNTLHSLSTNTAPQVLSSKSKSYPNISPSRRPQMRSAAIKAWLNNLHALKAGQEAKSALEDRLIARRAQSEPPLECPYIDTTLKPHHDKERRAQSVPLMSDEDVEMYFADDNENLSLSSGNVLGVIQESSRETLESDGSDSSPRASPVPTDVLFPDSQELVEELPSLGVKVFDYAYTAPYHNVPFSTISSSNKSAGTNPSTVPRLVPEVFDRLRALAEIDYRWSQKPRTRPVQGKTLRRLLDIQWLTEPEMHIRGAKMDFDALAEYDARPKHPCRSYGPKVRPTAQDRYLNMKAHLGSFARFDEQLEKHLNYLEWEAHEQQLVDAVKEERAKRGIVDEPPVAKKTVKGKGKGKTRSPPSSGSCKRRLDENGDDAVANIPGPSQTKGNGQKRRRLTPPPIRSGPQPPPGYIAQQFPAALHAATMGLKPPSFSQLRVATPPLEEEPPASQQSSKLAHPKGLRALGRTQTLIQL